MRLKQFQCVADTGCTCIGKSRSFHVALPPRGRWRIFLWIRRRRPLKVKFVYRTIISDDWACGLVIMASATRKPRQGGSNESGVLYDADSSTRQGLAAVPE